jgi:hypothetical protein
MVIVTMFEYSKHVPSIEAERANPGAHILSAGQKEISEIGADAQVSLHRSGTGIVAITRPPPRDATAGKARPWQG